MPIKFNAEHTKKALQKIKADSQYIELRILTDSAENYSGYFDSPDAAIAALNKLKPEAKAAVYVTLNAINLKRIEEADKDQINNFKKFAKNTKDKDITKRQWLFIDIDTIRAEGKEKYCATKEEKAKTKEGMQQCKQYLSNKGFPAPIVCDSGNGYHLLYRIDLDNTAENTELIKNFLNNIAALFSNYDIDTSVFNAARITKLYGTTPLNKPTEKDRPAQQSAFIDIPDKLEVLTADIIKPLAIVKAAAATAAPTQSQQNSVTNSNRRTQAEQIEYIRSFLQQHNISYWEEGYTDRGSYHFCLDNCAWQDTHTTRSKKDDAEIFIEADATIAYKCLHGHCSQKGWQDFRLMYEPNAYDKPDYKNMTKEQKETFCLYNAKIIKEEAAQVIFIVYEKEEAEALTNAGYNSVAITKYSKGKEQLIKYIRKNKRPDQHIIIMLPDKEEAEQLYDSLHRIGVAAINESNIYIDYADVKSMIDSHVILEALQESAITLSAEKQQELAEEYINANSNAAYLSAFEKSIEDTKGVKYISTGFKLLDKAISGMEEGGGIKEGLITIGAVSSLGKTTFVLQIADNIAAAGTDVIYIALEQARNELISKSISRITYELSKNKTGYNDYAITDLGIRSGQRYDRYNKEQLQNIEEAKGIYKDKHAAHIIIHEGIGNIGIRKVTEYINDYIRYTNKTPVLIIDYLQIMQFEDTRLTDKQNIDKIVLELKRIARDKHIPIFVISSFNRSSYEAPVTMTSFKESGAIEYTSDILIGLQYFGQDYQEKEYDKNPNRFKRLKELYQEREENIQAGKPIGVQLKILKNRSGSRKSLLFDYVPMFNHFAEARELQHGEKYEDSQEINAELVEDYGEEIGEGFEDII